jgi:WD40 repeat protein
VKFHPFINTIVVSGCLGGEVRIWDIQRDDGPLLEMKFPFFSEDPKQEQPKVKRDSGILSLCFHNNGQNVAVACGPHVYLWDYSNGKDPAIIFTTRNEYPIEIVDFPLKMHPNFILLGYNLRHSKTFASFLFYFFIIIYISPDKQTILFFFSFFFSSFFLLLFPALPAYLPYVCTIFPAPKLFENTVINLKFAI